ncbi:matrix metalloproteinase-2-like [Bactrocera tryoni]|uniref:matrix metalloproteinase-2-like n=1 Tax=Bactrocera tryoni TaxID=59916 RepID=UPI001A95B3CE|nr:matrix metalloproteinase-2-like [Bactrocera tryoni]XP_039956548.1 matrix metalloproteinase-2-like [Bactrocera tryoni]XP_039956549.1 matrix metalloproteinase-2-like [Bactrocera tryoni]XP_039956550.1 matrix metalloproteinase-2-like [Bactrocera tryoni]
MFRNSSIPMPTIIALFVIMAELIAAAEGVPRYHQYANNGKSAVSEDTVYNYLMEFDYLPKSDIETGALTTEEQLKDAIRKLQRFGNIPATGEIDESTQKLIHRPRCGVGDSTRTANFSPDNLQYGHHRMKRYVLQGPKWDKTDLTWSYI